MSVSRRAFVRALAVACIVPGSRPRDAAAQDPRASVTAQAARAWLAIVDRGDTAAAHAAAGEKFRNAMSANDWRNALAKERADRGKVLQRSLQRTSFEAAKGAPPGEYAVLVFRTAFERQTAASETLTLEREKDGAWRVVGYLIR